MHTTTVPTDVPVALAPAVPRRRLASDPGRSLFRTDRDPVGEDLPSDMRTSTSVRRLHRLALLATETGARSVREPGFGDPYAWLGAPRALFGGRCAIDAGLERDGLLAGLSFHFRAEHDGDGDHEGRVGRTRAGCGSAGGGGPGGRGGEDPGRPRLFTATIDVIVGRRRLQVFCAVVATHRSAVQRLMAARYGFAASARARYREGLPGADPVAAALVSTSTALAMVGVADAPESAPDGFEIRIERSLPV